MGKIKGGQTEAQALAKHFNLFCCLVFKHGKMECFFYFK
jgi:hypothetical protein